DYIIAEKLGSVPLLRYYKAFKKEKRDVVAIKCADYKKIVLLRLRIIWSQKLKYKNLHHENIGSLLTLLGIFSHIYLIMEYCNGGNLSNYIHKRQRLSENICQRFLQQVVLALLYLREKNISHFDLKPQNIFLASRNLQILKIGDFGLAQYISESDKSILIKGSPLYMAPEIVLKNEYDARADIWSVGVILYECLFGKAPYSSSSFEELMNKIKLDKPIEIPSNAKISPDCRDFLCRCLERDLSKRLDFNSFFQHPFVDLKHAPSPNSINKASIHLAKAVEEDKNKNYNQAYKSYNEAIKYLVPAMHLERDSLKRVNIRKKVEEYINRMEKLKIEIMSENSDLPRGITSPTIKINPILIYEGNLHELLQLTKTTPQMTTAIEIAQSAELYEQERNYSSALEKYEMALGKLISLLPNEPKGRRKDLLMEEVNRWMNQAEKVKMIQQGDSNALNDLPIADSDKACCIQ
ncbi:UNVERIFIED_CONTAM: hypothetical protein GTU68_031183, partial [Idotea baltica]|nr:hypothetical protein [Idotea baltica]